MEPNPPPHTPKGPQSSSTRTGRGQSLPPNCEGDRAPRALSMEHKEGMKGTKSRSEAGRGLETGREGRKIKGVEEDEKEGEGEGKKPGQRKEEERTKEKREEKEEKHSKEGRRGRRGEKREEERKMEGVNEDTEKAEKGGAARSELRRRRCKWQRRPPPPCPVSFPCPASPPGTPVRHLSVSAPSSVLSGGAGGSKFIVPCGGGSPSSRGASTPAEWRRELSWVEDKTLPPGDSISPAGEGGGG